MLNIYKPKSDRLKKYINFFYTFSEEKPHAISYICFPHTSTAITFFKNVEITRSDHSLYLKPVDVMSDELNIFNIDVVGKFTRPLFFQYCGNVQEINIVFKPLGICHFLKESFSSIAPNFSQEYADAQWKAFAPLLFEEESEELQISLLETFLLENLQAHDLALMYKAIAYLEDLDDELSIAEIASLLDMNLKTFQRHFYKHFACTPSDYRRIVRFRRSLNSGILSKDLKKLTALTYESNYCDQSYFVREYKKLAMLSPRVFFNKISALNEHKVIWEIK